MIVRPTRFNPKHIPDIASLYPILQRTSVSLRGWDFPHLDSHKSPQIDIDWIGEELDWEHHIYVWRFYQSGQFFHLSNMSIDWRDQSSFWPPDKDWKPNTLLGVGDTIACLTEIFEFATRLALSEAGDERMHIEIIVGNLVGRALYVDSHKRWPFDYRYSASIKEFPYSIDLSKTDLIAKSREFALEGATELFKRFGWSTTIEILRSWQEELRLRR